MNCKYFNLTKTFLIQQYVIKKLPATLIAKKVKCAYNTIYRALIKFNIKIRTQKEIKTGLRGKYVNRYIDGRTNKILHCLDCPKQISNYQHLRCSSCNKKYFDLLFGGHMLGKHHSKKSKRMISISKGGTGIPYQHRKYPECFNKELKLKIRIRDKFKCKGCGIKEKNHYRDLDIHHIDYNKYNCKFENLVTTCTSCNSKANYTRDYWYAYYIYIMENKNA